jgi:hypothetical protein
MISTTSILYLKACLSHNHSIIAYSPHSTAATAGATAATATTTTASTPIMTALPIRFY